MNYGVTRKFEIYDFDKEEKSVVIARPSAWYEASMFQEKHEAPEAMANVFGVYIWGYFAIKHAGLAKKYGIPESLTVEVIPEIMQRLSITVAEVSDADFEAAGPLA